MNQNKELQIFSPENLIILIPALICFYAGFLVLNYPVDMVLNDEIYLLLDIRINNFTLDWNEFWKDKAGTRWPLYKLLFSISANNGWYHGFFLFSGFASLLIFFLALYYIFKSEDVKFTYSIAFIFGLFFLIRPNSFYIFFHSLISERMFELYVIFTLCLLSIYFYEKEKKLISCFFVLFASFIVLLTGHAYGVGIIMAMIPVIFLCFRLQSGLLYKALLIIIFIITIKLYSDGISILANNNILDFFHIWKNPSWLIYFFITPFSELFDFGSIQEDYIDLLIIGSIVFVPLAIWIFLNRSNSLLMKFSFFSLVCFVFAGGILYVGESPVLSKCPDLKCLSSKMHFRFQLVPFGTLLVGFALLHLSQKNESNHVKINFFKFLILFFLFFLASISIFKEMQKFENAVEKRYILSEALHSGNNEEFEKLPCWRKIGYWRAMDDKLCNALIETYMLMKNGEEKIKIDIFSVSPIERQTLWPG